MRGTRSLGYGFVEMASDADAQAVVRALHKKSFDSREINVEIARSRVTDEELAARANKPRRRTRNRGGRDGAAAGNGAGNGGAAPAAAGGADGAARSNGGRRRNNAGGADRPPRAAADQADRPLSETTVFVANLPFSVTNAELLDAFKAAKATDAVVSCRASGRSKGFGFVKFNKGDVAAAVAAMDGKSLADRKLTVRVAMTEFDVEKQRNDAIQANVGKDGEVPSKRATAE